ncbi:MAG: hypothetical protein R3F59_26245 [Myxococcota bacterium]
MRPTLVPLLFALGCSPPDPTEGFTEVSLTVAPDAASAEAPFVDAIDGAERELRIALPAGEDEALADAIVRAYARGVDVQVVTDYDLAETPAVARLRAEGVPVALRDAGLAYFDFSTLVDLIFPSEMTRMDHAYVVVDGLRIVAGSTLGRTGPGTRIVVNARGEDLVSDLLDEHRQVWGGTDAVAVDAYSAPSKSIVDPRWRYGTTTSTDLQLWFGPQERVLKRVIDAVYSARSGVYVLTDDFANEGLARALQTKARWGFDVQVVVGPHFGTDVGASQILEQTTPSVEKRRLLPDPAATQDEVIPTIVLIDLPPDAEGYRPYTRAFVLNHDLYSAERVYRGRPIVTDQLIDAAMWVWTDVDQPGAAIRDLFDVYRDHYNRAVQLGDPPQMPEAP